MKLKTMMLPAMLIVLISSSVVVHVVMLIVASSDPSFAVVKDTDRDGAWAATMRQRRENERLAWTFETELRPPAAPGILSQAYFFILAVQPGPCQQRIAPGAEAQTRAIRLAIARGQRSALKNIEGPRIHARVFQLVVKAIAAINPGDPKGVRRLHDRRGQVHAAPGNSGDGPRLGTAGAAQVYLDILAARVELSPAQPAVRDSG